MSPMPRFKGVMYTTEALFRQLITEGSITVDGYTYTYDPDMLYVTDLVEKTTVTSINGLTGDVKFSSSDLTDGSAILKTSNIGTSAGKIPVLSSNGKLDENLLPAIAFTDVYEATSETAMLLLTAQRGDICIRTDVNKTFVLRGTPANTLSNWIELRTPTNAVLSVNGKTGAVALSSSDLTDGNTLAKTAEVDAKLEAALGSADQNVLELLESKVDVDTFNLLDTRVTDTETDVLALQNTKLDRVEGSTQTQVYGVGSSGNQVMFAVTQNPTNSALVRRYGNQIKVPEQPANKDDATSKQYVDTTVSTAIDNYSETDPTVPDWAKQPAKPQYEYSEILNTPNIPEGATLYNTTGQNTDGAMTQKATTDALDLKLNTSDVNFDAISFAEKERLKVENNLFDLIFNGNVTQGTVLDVSEHITLSVDTSSTALGVTVKTDISTDGYVYTFNSMGSVYECFLNIIFKNLKPHTQYRINFYQTGTGRFLNSPGEGAGYKAFTTDINGEYAWLNAVGYGLGFADSPLIVSNIQVVEYDKYEEFQKYYGPIIHQSTMLSTITGLLSTHLSIKDYYIDPLQNTDSGDTQTMNYIVTNPIIGGKSLKLIWGGSPTTASTGFLTGAPSGVGWIPTSSEGVQAKLFTSPANYRAIATPYAGTQYSYSWRIINYLNNGFGGINIRYGNDTSGIRFNYFIIGLEE